MDTPKIFNIVIILLPAGLIADAVFTWNKMTDKSFSPLVLTIMIGLAILFILYSIFMGINWQSADKWEWYNIYTPKGE